MGRCIRCHTSSPFVPSVLLCRGGLVVVVVVTVVVTVVEMVVVMVVVTVVVMVVVVGTPCPEASHNQSVVTVVAFELVAVVPSQAEEVGFVRKVE